MQVSDFSHGYAYATHQYELRPTRIGPVVILERLPPCACGTPSDDALLRAIFAILDGEFEGVKELKGRTPGTEKCLALTYTNNPDHTIWLRVDPESIEGTILLLLLKDIISGTRKSERDLAAYAMHAIELDYTRAGRASEFGAAVQRILDKQHAQEQRQ